jgi:MFS family permease
VTARYAALQSADFRRLWAGLFVSNIGTWMQNVAQSWLIYRMTGDDPLYLGYLGFSFALPMTLLPPIGGAIADRIDRKRLLTITQTSQLALAVVLATLAWTHALRPWHMLTASFTGATLLAFDNPTRQALLPDLVPRESLQNALSLSAATFTGAALVGPGIAGALLGRIGPGWLFFLNAVSYLAVLGAIARLSPLPPHAPPKIAWTASLAAGLRFAWNERTIRVLLALAATAALFARSYQQLLPIFAARVWHAGPTAYGALLSAGGAGALIGAVGLSSARATERHVPVMIASGAALAVALGAFAYMPVLPLGVAMLVVVGICATVFTTMIATKIQLDVPREMRGRVVGIYTITLIGMPALGALVMAAVARRVGAPGAVVGGAMTLLVAMGSSAHRLRRAP